MNSPWYNHISSLLHQSGLSYIWDTHSFPNHSRLKNTYSRILEDQQLQFWSSEVSSNSKCVVYRIYKETLKFETYLTALPKKWSLTLSRLRTGNHRLPVVAQRYENVPRDQRICTLCDKHDIGDEYHYILKCPSFNELRHELLPSYCWVRPNILKLQRLLNDKNVDSMKKLAIFILHVFESV